MSKFSISQYLPPDVEEGTVDQIGRAMLTEQARAQGIRITGDPERVYDEFVVGVRVPDSDNNLALKHVPIGSPLAGGRTDPDARMVTWEADSEPITSDPAPRVDGQIGNDGHSHALLPREVVEHGGMVTFRHGIRTGEVLIFATAADGSGVGYEFAVEVTAGEHQVLLPPGVSHLRAEAEGGK